jgi:uncharacterized membrane protein YheB (UPF0754 family)
MPFERNPDPFRKKIEIDPAAEDRIQTIIDNFKSQAKDVVMNSRYANDNVRQTLLGSLELLNPDTIIASIIDNQYGKYTGKTLQEQFKTWMSINFIGRELYELQSDAIDEKRSDEGRMISMIADELTNVLLGDSNIGEDGR